MKYVINALLVLLIGYLCFRLYSSIKEPIAFQEVKNARQQVVVAKLQDIQKVQEIYRDITGEFAASFDSLVYVLKNDSIPFVNLIGDPDDPENMDKVIKIVTYSAAIDSIKSMGINLDSIAFVPFAPSGTQFDIDADTLTYQSSNVSVVEVGTRWEVFMGKFGDPLYQKYDSRYDPKARLKFGDMSKPTLTGNWE
jgi:hypothetical protein